MPIDREHIMVSTTLAFASSCTDPVLPIASCDDHAAQRNAYPLFPCPRVGSLQMQHAFLQEYWALLWSEQGQSDGMNPRSVGHQMRV